ncbi:uncharacterized protein LOC127098317 [Lathyrus oleraceus]|uniref:uncharacterized protein LOC127098317 n=1 Tax=Pisum sativum TaxID=3888 RepID=UPI0021CF6EE9|nr:uncharacterized protein LOC127098317 [Pisum sativum]
MAKINCESGLPINQAEDDSEEDCELPAELARLLEHEEKEIQPYKEPVYVINLGSETDKKEVSPEEGPEPGSRWTLVFDGASNARGHGIGVVITSPTGFHIPFTARLCFDCTNNMAEYEACIYGLEAAIDLRIKILEVFGDSALVISQVKGDWETRDIKLIPYKEHIRKLIPYFDEISFHHISREENQLAYALATLASMFKVKWKNEAPSIQIDHLAEPAHCLAIEVDPYNKPWFYDIKTFMKK